MNLVEKRDFIHSRLHQADENLIDQIYELLCKEENLNAQRMERGHLSEKDLKVGKGFSRAERDRKSSNANQKDFYFHPF
jgi:hypothetical protein